MQSPFDAKNKFASLLDRLAFALLLGSGSVAYFLYLWRQPLLSLLAGGALFVLLLLTLALFERHTLKRRNRALRERIGGAMALEDIVLLPYGAACERVCSLLCAGLGAQPLPGCAMRYEGETWLVRCAQCLQDSSVGEGDVLSAHRARLEKGMQRCVLASTGNVSPAATRAAQWLDPPIRLIAGRQLAALAGRLHPATDEDIARRAHLRKKPYTFARIRALALSPAKLRRYLLCAFLLLIMYLNTRSPLCLASCLLAFALALLCRRAATSRFSLS